MRILPVTGCIAHRHRDRSILLCHVGAGTPGKTSSNAALLGLARALLYGTEASAPGCASAKLKGGFDEWNR